jgi:hypothetical protein
MSKEKVDKEKSNVTVKETGATTTTMAQEAGSTKPEAEALGVNAEERHNLSLYQQYIKEIQNAKDPEQRKALEKLRDEVKSKAGNLIPA